MGRQSPSRVRIPPSPPHAATLIGRFAAPVAQLDRASVYGTEGQRFESSRARRETAALRRFRLDAKSLSGAPVPGIRPEHATLLARSWGRSFRGPACGAPFVHAGGLLLLSAGAQACGGSPLDQGGLDVRADEAPMPAELDRWHKASACAPRARAPKTPSAASSATHPTHLAPPPDPGAHPGPDAHTHNLIDTGAAKVEASAGFEPRRGTGAELVCAKELVTAHPAGGKYG